MSRAASAIVLWLFVINLGVTFGAGIYEHRMWCHDGSSHQQRGCQLECRCCSAG